MTDAPFVVSSLTVPFPPPLLSSFKTLEPDVLDYHSTGFQSRFRRFGVFRVEAGIVSEDRRLSTLFNNRKPFHTRFGIDVKPLSSEVVETRIIVCIVEQLLKCPLLPSSRLGIGVNQVRVIADGHNCGSTAPSFHQDGYDLSCHIAVDRHNAIGGESILSRSQADKDVFLRRRLQPGEFMLFDDRKNFHTATPIRAKVIGESCSRDMLILDVIKMP
jgi:hypothetical protein